MLIGVQFYVSFPAGCLKVCPALAISSKKDDANEAERHKLIGLKSCCWNATVGCCVAHSKGMGFGCLTAASVGDHRPSWASLRHDMGKASGILWSQPPVMTYCDPKAAAPRHLSHLSIPLCQVQILVDDVCSDHWGDHQTCLTGATQLPWRPAAHLQHGFASEHIGNDELIDEPETSRKMRTTTQSAPPMCIYLVYVSPFAQLNLWRERERESQSWGSLGHVTCVATLTWGNWSV